MITCAREIVNKEQERMHHTMGRGSMPQLDAVENNHLKALSHGATRLRGRQFMQILAMRH